MPQLSKKTINPPKKQKGTFKAPILTKENIEKLLCETEIENNGPTFLKRTTQSKLKDISVSGSDLSTRLNEPVIKKAYLDFCKNKNEIEQFNNLTVNLSPIDNDRAVTSTQITNTDSVQSLSQQQLNQKEVKEAYISFCLDESLLNESIDFMKDLTFKKRRPKKCSNISKGKLKHLNKVCIHVVLHKICTQNLPRHLPILVTQILSSLLLSPF